MHLHFNRNMAQELNGLSPAEEFLEELEIYNTSVPGEHLEKRGIYLLSDVLDAYLKKNNS